MAEAINEAVAKLQPASLKIATGEAKERSPDYFGNGTIPIVEAMSIAILEAVVHGWTCVPRSAQHQLHPGGCMDHTVACSQRGRSGAFIEAATGRVTLRCSQCCVEPTNVLRLVDVAPRSTSSWSVRGSIEPSRNRSDPDDGATPSSTIVGHRFRLT